MDSIFLSASTPDPKRDPKYYSTADLSAIRDAVRALVTVAMPTYRIVWGGHPSITPLVQMVVEGLGLPGSKLFGLFQSNYFRKVLPKENAAFEHVVKTKAARLSAKEQAEVVAAAGPDADEAQRRKAVEAARRDASLDLMRREMISSAPFTAAVFIGGMEGVEAEYDLFRQLQPAAPVYPIASTGGAAGLLYQRDVEAFDPSLADDLAYPALFRRLLKLSPPAPSTEPPTPRERSRRRRGGDAA